jgi:hypothetical protein
MPDRFSRHVHPKRGGLHGWCEHCGPEARHRALRETVRVDGYATTIRRLNYLHNVANRSNNRELRSRAESDLHWVQRNFRGGD